MNRLEYIYTWQKNNWSKVLEYKRRWRERNPERMRSARKNWADNNVERIKSVTRERKRRKYHTDPNYREEVRIRRKFTLWLFRGVSKRGRACKMEVLAGASKQRVRDYIQSLFSHGMNWDNHGFFGWHIDHKIPCSQFDLTDPEEQKRCFHYTNLQPLWHADHIRKHGKEPGTLL